MLIRDPIFAAFCGTALGLGFAWLVIRTWRAPVGTPSPRAYWKRAIAHFGRVGIALFLTPLLYVRASAFEPYYGWFLLAPFAFGGVVGGVVLLVPPLDGLLPPAIREQVRDQQRWPPWADRRRSR